MEPPISLHSHRLDNNSSKLPSWRISDLSAKSLLDSASSNEDNARPKPVHQQHWPSETATTISIPPTSPPENNIKREHVRNHSESVTNTPPRPSLQPRPVTSPGGLAIQFNSSSQLPPVAKQKARNVPASHSGNNGYLGKGPPPAMITQQKVPLQVIETENSTKDWVVNQSVITATSPNEERKPLPAEPQESKPITPLIPPIRGFKTSRRSSGDINVTSPRATSMDQDETVRPLDGYNAQRLSHREQEEQSSDDSDLFLKLARDETVGNSRGPIRRSQINRQSLPPNHTVFQSPVSRRRGSDQESTSGGRSGEEQLPQALTYRSSARDRVPTVLDMSRNRYYGANSHSTPTTPRALGSREISPESQASYSGRRPSVHDQGVPSRSGSYRQSNLSHSTPRTFNSSPLVSRTTDVHDTPETHRAAEGTESTVSTTAPSTVWDELEDLKSRIHRLELTGKLPATSGAAISRASNDRPPTATTTVTTMSSSPKRGRGNSISPTDPNAVETSPSDSHPLLSSALAKTKSLLSPEVYNALEAAAADALVIASMMGSSGQPGPISSSQSTIGGGSNVVSDRQVRRKADSMCRSLTELCLALSEGKSEQISLKQNSPRPKSRDAEPANIVDNTQRQPIVTDLARAKSSPRALSRLEARRSSLLATSSLPSPRYAPSEAGTPTQSSMAGRRTSLLLRSRRGATEEAEEEDDTRYRAPSRAATEIGRIRNSPREYISQPPLLDNRTPAIQSSLPVRRHYVSTSLTNSSTPAVPAVANVNGRRYLDRATPERDTTGVAGRLAEDRAQRKSSIGQGFPLGRTGSLTRRTRQPSSMDASNPSQAGAYR